MAAPGPNDGAGSWAKRFWIALALIVGLVLVGAIAAALLAHPSSSASTSHTGS